MMPLRHGHAVASLKTPEYQSWTHMKARCLNPRNKNFANYGGRGITICSRWMQFANFLADMGPRPAGTSIDRFPDPNGNYEPSNCRWATRKQQARAKRTTRILEFKGLALPLAEWAERIGVTYQTLVMRLRNGFSIERALSSQAVSRSSPPAQHSTEP